MRCEQQPAPEGTRQTAGNESIGVISRSAERVRGDRLGQLQQKGPDHSARLASCLTLWVLDGSATVAVFPASRSDSRLLDGVGGSLGHRAWDREVWLLEQGGSTVRNPS